MGFRKDFAWGAATSSYQIEGAVKGEGKGEHIWDVYVQEPGHVFEGHTGETACDHYHRYREDVRLMKEMGLKAYRFSIDWPVTPEVLYRGPKFLYERYQKPMYITENGISCHDVISLDGKVHDPNRIDFLARYLHELKRAADEIDLRGYFQWSLMDNFEWSKGYSERFGLIYVDFRNQQRILKDSAYWYRDVIQTNGENL